MQTNNNLHTLLNEQIYWLLIESKNDPYDPANQGLIKNYLEIGNFLENEKTISSCLVELENKINETFQNKGIDIKSDAINDDYTKGSIKVLRNYMLDYLTPFGFSEKMVIPADILSENEFYNILKNKFLIKDSSFRGVGHGEFTHLLQWYLIAYGVNKGMIKLNKPLIDIYIEIGRILKYQEVTGVPQSIWDILVDSSALNNEYSKFRSPEYITEYFLNTDRKDLSTLTFLFTYRLSLAYMEKHRLKINEDEEESSVVLDEKSSDTEEVKKQTYSDKLNEKYNLVKNKQTNKYYIDKNLGKNVLVFNSEYDKFRINYRTQIKQTITNQNIKKFKK